jgi:hypothetical protein
MVRGGNRPGNGRYDAGMLARRKDGNHSNYRIADEAAFALCEHVAAR